VISIWGALGRLRGDSAETNCSTVSNLRLSICLSSPAFFRAATARTPSNVPLVTCANLAATLCSSAKSDDSGHYIKQLTLRGSKLALLSSPYARFAVLRQSPSASAPASMGLEHLESAARVEAPFCRPGFATSLGCMGMMLISEVRPFVEPRWANLLLPCGRLRYPRLATVTPQFVLKTLSLFALELRHEYALAPGNFC
jgi:hypothetical protein